MSAVVLESFVGSEYEDTPSGHEFPERYLPVFDGLVYPVVAVLYEPRGDGGRGRMAYVALAQIPSRPTLTGARSGNGQRLWHVAYSQPAQEFDNAVPREPMGEPAERWLSRLPRGRERNVATFGRAVRRLDDEDLTRILELGNARLLEATYPTASEHQDAEKLVAERPRRLVETLQREASFRNRVLSAYDYRCAISGLGLGAVAPTRSRGLIDAAHIRPVARMGSDFVSNGIPLTPTLHRLFDAGLFTVSVSGGHFEVKTSPHLEDGMISAPERGASLPLSDGLPLLLPQDRASWPNLDGLRFHAREVFRG